MLTNGKNLVYIVDDDPDDRQMILDAFLENNPTMDYVFIEDGEELMRTMQSTPKEEVPSLILLDLNMPGMMGLHALKEIRTNNNFSSIPTIILTTSTLSTDKSASYRMGANCYLNKPQSYQDLVEITTAINRLWFSKREN